jgi:hypothetical protein
MEPVKAEFIPGNSTNDDTSADTQRETQDIDGSIQPVARQYPPGNEEITLDHALFFRKSRQESAVTLRF